MLPIFLSLLPVLTIPSPTPSATLIVGTNSVVESTLQFHTPFRFIHPQTFPQPTIPPLPPVINDIATIATQYHLPLCYPLSVAFYESHLNPSDVGDYGTSFGLFQLHRGGELGSLTPSQAFNPTTNASVAIPVLASTYDPSNVGLSASLAQRPSNPIYYTSRINALYNECLTTLDTSKWA